MIDGSKLLRLGTRGSLLARMQSERIAQQIRELRPGLNLETLVIKTTGDRVQDTPLHDIGGKGLFTKELEQALLAREIDFAVHSYKDVPVTMPLLDIAALTIAAVPAREDARDVLVTREGCPRIAYLPPATRVGTGSLRRRSELLSIRSDLQAIPIRGNIDTRLRKLRDRELDAVILAAAGLLRAELFDPTMMIPIEVMEMVPSSGQGALALQCRSDDTDTLKLLLLLNDPVTAMCVGLERDLVRLLQADCQSPVGIHARIFDDEIQLAAAIGARGGTPPVVHVVATGRLSDRHDLVDKVYTELEARGAMSALHPLK